MSEQDRSWSPENRPPAEIEAPPLRLRRWRVEDSGSLERELHRSRAHLSEGLAWARDSDHTSVTGFLLGADAAFEARTDFAYALVGLLQDRERAARMGAEAERRVRAQYLAPRHLIQYLSLLQALLTVPTVGQAVRD